MKRIPFNLERGQNLGPHYLIEESLGHGWEGEVYKIRERKTGVIRAAKIFYDQNGSREAPVLQYARKLYKLRTCPILIQYHHHDSVRINGAKLDFLVSDFADGEMLSAFLKRQKGRRLAEFEALRLLYELASGIERVHMLGEYHGDIHSDNILIKRRGLEFDVHLIDFYHLGRPTKEKIQNDVIFLISILFEAIGGEKYYSKASPQIKQIIAGRKHCLISKRYKTAGQLRRALENLEW